MEYIDGFVAAVPTKNREEYKKHVVYSAQVFKEHGALRVVECWGDEVPDGEVTSFRKAVQQKDDETICFSWIVWPTKEVRDAGMKKVFADERMKPENNPMPFDGKRLIYGGFTVLVDVWGRDSLRVRRGEAFGRGGHSSTRRSSSRARLGSRLRFGLIFVG